ncbi:MAG TPA: MoxR family ATPase [Thermoanaerobaculia bacterium]|nr:MoxR family ATPase [Thermoanaerobaculia bacterium]
MTVDPQLLNDRIAAAHGVITALRGEIGRVIVGQHELVDRLIIALLIRGHLLVEGVPGLAKTLVVKTLAAAIDATFHRVQFTPDLLPADITGTLIFDPPTGKFNPRFGPIFANLLLADEINRAPGKVQSALLEAMQERQVTIGGLSYRLPDPFVVMATQNPIEHEGTYALPEAQVDRFVMKVLVDYPGPDEELRMLELYLDPRVDRIPVRKVIGTAEIAELAELVALVHVDRRISSYAVDLVSATRDPARFGLQALRRQIAYGASPRATLALVHAAKGFAFLQGRPFVIPEDVKAIAHEALRHRLLLTYEAAAERVTPDRLVDQILAAVPVP